MAEDLSVARKGETLVIRIPHSEGEAQCERTRRSLGSR